MSDSSWKEQREKNAMKHLLPRVDTPLFSLLFHHRAFGAEAVRAFVYLNELSIRITADSMFGYG